MPRLRIPAEKFAAARLMEPGWYQGKVTTVTWGKSKSSSNMMYTIVLEVGPHNKVFKKYIVPSVDKSITHPETIALMRALNGDGIVEGGFDSTPEQDWPGKDLYCHVTVTAETDKNKNPTGNQVDVVDDFASSSEDLDELNTPAF